MVGTARICATGLPRPGCPNPQAKLSCGQASVTGGHAGLNGGQAGVMGGQARVKGGHRGVNTWQPGPKMVHRALHVAAGGIVQAGVMHGKKGEWHGPAIVHWTLQVAACTWVMHGTKGERQS